MNGGMASDLDAGMEHDNGAAESAEPKSLDQAIDDLKI